MGANGSGTKTHCPRGHEYTPENTRFAPRGRVCRTCARERNYGIRSERTLQREQLDDKAVQRLVDAINDGVTRDACARRFGISVKEVTDYYRRSLSRQEAA